MAQQVSFNNLFTYTKKKKKKFGYFTQLSIAKDRLHSYNEVNTKTRILDIINMLFGQPK